MCGIVGAMEITGSIPSNIYKSACDAIDLMQPRGPDGRDISLTKNGILGHVRLSIFDLSENGAQPMLSDDENSIITYNGEIYNFEMIREELRQDFGWICYRSTSDTEVLLKFLDFHGAERLGRLNGMFAFAYSNIDSNTFFLVRDKYGIKPVYYSLKDGVLYFASQVQALLTLMEEKAEILEDKLLEYLYFGCSVGEQTMLRGVNQLEPGCYLSLDFGKSCLIKKSYLNDSHPSHSVSLVEDIDKQSVIDTFVGATERQLKADVPAGVFLSGGIDSNIIAWCASKGLDKQVDTFTASFDFSEDDESAMAARASKAYGTKHHPLKITSSGVPDVMDYLATNHSTPLGDYADIPLYLMSKAVGNDAKVVLQGDGGDELFGGYSRYKTLRQIDLLPIYPRFAFRFCEKLAGTLPRKHERLKRYLDLLASSPEDRFVKLMTTESKYRNPARLLKNKCYLKGGFSEASRSYREVIRSVMSASHLQTMFDVDRRVVLPELFMRKVDESTMAASIEARVPFLDDEVVSLSERFSPSLKVYRGESKFVLKHSFSGLLNDEVVYGKKKGLTVPVGAWLKGPLRSYFYDKVKDKLVGNYLDGCEIDSLYREHVEEKRDNSQILWRILCFSVWVDANRKYFY